MESMETTRHFWTVAEVADFLRVSKSLVYDQVYKGKIPAKRLGTRILIPANYVATLTE